MATTAASPNVDILLNGKQVPDEHFLSYVVDRDMFQPDMASIVLANQGDVYSTQKVGDTVEVKVGDGGATSVYKGEIVGLEPVYKGGEKTRILIRAMNKLHRLLRKRKSITFTDKTDQAILSQVVSSAGLSLQWKHEKSITYKHVYQHNLTDMEFSAHAGRAHGLPRLVRRHDRLLPAAGSAERPDRRGQRRQVRERHRK